MECELNYKEKNYKILIEGNKVISINGELIDAEITKLTNCTFIVKFNTRQFICYGVNDGDNFYVNIFGVNYVLRKTKGKLNAQVSEKSYTITSPMPGLVTKLFISIGDKVKVGQLVGIVEAMKMENELRAPIAGVIKKINYQEGSQIEAFKPLVDIEPE